MKENSTLAAEPSHTSSSLESGVRNRPVYQRLSQSSLARLKSAVWEILEDIGIRIADEEARDIFRSAGASLDGDLVKIPHKLTDWALEAAPRELVLYDQVGEPAIHLKDRCAYFGNGSDLPYIIDHRDGLRRSARLGDVRDMIHLLHHLEHIDFVMSGFLPRDVAVEKAERLQMRLILQHTSKPLIYVNTDLANVRYSVAMMEACAGGEEAFRQKPFSACYINIANPLRHNAESLRKLIWLSRKGLPFIYRPSLITRGITTPHTEAGFLAVNSAAVMAGLVLSQLVREGTSFIGDSSAGGTFDMKTMVGQLAAPEIRGFNEELLHLYRLPGFGNGAVSGSKVIDAQAGLEAALTLLTSVQSGAQLIHDVGYMDNGATGSLPQMIICHDLIGWIKACMNPIEVNDATLDLGTIREVTATQGDFLGSENTLEHYRNDFYPEVIDRQNFDSWKKTGASDILDQATSKVNKILSLPENDFLNDAKKRALQEIIGL